MSDPVKKTATHVSMAEEEVECIEMRISPNGTYEVYKASSADIARRFLKNKDLDYSYAHILVETPEGNWGKDSEGIYLEKLLPFQQCLDTAQCRGSIKGSVSALGLKMAAMGFFDNFIANIKCGRCGHIWLDGLRYRNQTLVKCPECLARNLVDSKRLICPDDRNIS